MPYARTGNNRQNGAFRLFTPDKQRRYMATARAVAEAAVPDDFALIDGPIRLTVVAHYSHPKTWAPRRRLLTFWKTSRPDLSNIVKLIEDALNPTKLLPPVVWNDDAQIVVLRAAKHYDDRDYLSVTIEPLGHEHGLRWV